MVWFGIAALLVAAAALFFAATVTLRTHNDAKDIAKTALEMQFRYGPLVMQTASALLERENTRVNQRVKLINSLGQPQGEGENAPPPPVGEAPPMGTSAMVDDAHEIAREVTRFRRTDIPPEMVREPGVGDEFTTGGDGTVMQGGKPLEI